jgi:hypothetical protein
MILARWRRRGSVLPGRLHNSRVVCSSGVKRTAAGGRLMATIDSYDVLRVKRVLGVSQARQDAHYSQKVGWNVILELVLVLCPIPRHDLLE